jgi:hypothetical protein
VIVYIRVKQNACELSPNIIGRRAGKAEFRRRFATFFLHGLPGSQICLLLITRAEYIDKVSEKSRSNIQ